MEYLLFALLQSDNAMKRVGPPTLSQALNVEHLFANFACTSISQPKGHDITACAAAEERDSCKGNCRHQQVCQRKKAPHLWHGALDCIPGGVGAPISWKHGHSNVYIFGCRSTAQQFPECPREAMELVRSGSDLCRQHGRSAPLPMAIPLRKGIWSRATAPNRSADQLCWLRLL